MWSLYLIFIMSFYIPAKKMPFLVREEREESGNVNWD